MSKYDAGKARAMFGGKGVYIALALCLVVVGVLGWFALFGGGEPAENVVNPTPVVEQQQPDPVEADPAPEPEPEPEPE
ncbi:MAG: hypothetical protein IJB04_04790, partial [Oscillospiraceae bacterium]|nr:hypothetical protein [Oscillospiraceae bacterium]